MKKNGSENIASMYRRGEISMDEAENRLWAEMYTNPSRYGLVSLDEDELSDFLLSFRPRFRRIIESYDESVAEFETFARNCALFFKMTWRKKQLKIAAERQSLENEIRHDAVESVRPFDDTSNPADIFSGTAARRVARRSSVRRRKIEEDARTTALVLAMKSCRDVDDEALEKLSAFTGIGGGELLKMIESLKSCPETRTARNRRMLMARRDETYYRKRKYEAELGRLDESSHEYMRLRERYERQERAWQKANESLEEGKIPTPKNSDIARILGIKQRKVYYCISHAKEKGVIEDYSEIFKKESEENDPKDEKR